MGQEINSNRPLIAVYACPCPVDVRPFHATRLKAVSRNLSVLLMVRLPASWRMLIPKEGICPVDITRKALYTERVAKATTQESYNNNRRLCLNRRKTP